jgi:hypothetical protein
MQTAKAKHAVRQVFRKSSEMPHFICRWRGLAWRSSIQIKQI